MRTHMRMRAIAMLAAIGLSVLGPLALPAQPAAAARLAQAPPPLTPEPRRQAEPDPGGGAGGGAVVTNTTTNIVTYNATTFFPTQAVSQTILGIVVNALSGMARSTGPTIQAVMQISMFGGVGALGSVDLPPDVAAIGAYLRVAAAPLWVLSIVLVAYDVVKRNASGQGIAGREVVEGLTRAALVIIVSANGVSLVAAGHRAIGGLTRYIWEVLFAGVLPVDRWVARFTPPDLIGADIGAQILALAVLIVVGLALVIVMIASYLARYTFLMAIGALAPLALATEGIEPIRFVARGWVVLFFKLELMQMLNAVVIVLFVSLGFVLDVGDAVASVFVRVAGMVGLASALIALNMSVFRDVFGTAMDVAGGALRVAGAAVGLAVTAASGGAAGGLALAAAGSTQAGQAASGGLGLAGEASSSGAGSAIADPAGAAMLRAATSGRVAAYSRVMASVSGDPLSEGFAAGASAGAATQRDDARLVAHTAHDAYASAGAGGLTPAERRDARYAAESRERVDLDRARGIGRMLAPDDMGLSEGLASDIMRAPAGAARDARVNAYRSTAAELRRYDRQLGGRGPAVSRETIAVRAGFVSYRDMVGTLATARLSSNGPGESAEFWQGQLAHPPASSDPGADGVTPWDRAQAVLTARAVGADDSLIPEWTETIASVRFHSLGAEQLGDMLKEARESGMTERALRDAIDTRIASQPVEPSPGLDRFWSNTPVVRPGDGQASAHDR